MNKPKRNFGFPIGCPSLIMVLVIMCLTTFAVISYVSAEREYRLSLKSAESIAQFQEADNKANIVVSTIHNSIINGTPISSIKNNLSNYEALDIYVNNNEYIAEFNIHIKDEMYLYVKTEFDNNGYKSTSIWKVVNKKIVNDEPIFLDLPTFN